MHLNVTVFRCWSTWLSVSSFVWLVSPLYCWKLLVFIRQSLRREQTTLRRGADTARRILNLIYLLLHEASAFSETFAVLRWEISLINGCIPVQYSPYHVAHWCNWVLMFVPPFHWLSACCSSNVMLCICYANIKLPPINWCIAWKFNEIWDTFNGSVKAWTMYTISSALLIRQ